MMLKRGSAVIAFAIAVLLLIGTVSAELECIECHEEVTPNIVKDFLSGAMGKPGVQNPVANDMAGGREAIGCKNCHGSKHTTMTDYDEAKMPTPDTCDICHAPKVAEFSAGKHAFAWAAMHVMPTTKDQPKEIIAGQKGCGGCHKMGTKTETGWEKYRYGVASCDSCHTRHSFSTAEARRPEACLPCHMGFDHPQWEMYSTSKHGVVYSIEGSNWDWSKRLSEADYSAPTCQLCHMPNGDHNVMTSWGFLAVRLPEKDEKWLADRTEILKALGVLDANGNPTARFDVVKAAKVARLTEEEWQALRDKKLKVCYKCHSQTFAKQNLENADAIIREADAVMADAIKTVKGLYEDGILPKPSYYAELPSYPYPDLLRFYEVRSPIEQDLYLMFLEYRMRAFQGAFHMNPDYMHWYGWAPLKEAAVRIKDEAQRLREDATLKAELEKVKMKAPATPAPAEKGICGPTAIAAIAVLPVVLYGLLRRRR
jgi:nitrate/TMAO reductase-like tetraheme cytochrome c subunit